MDEVWDCVIVGGGAAGLSAALVLGRARRRTLVVDAGEPSNAVAHGIGGLLGHDGRRPAELYAAGRSELVKYPQVELRAGTVTDVRRGEVFTVELSDGTVAAARRIVLATGMRYRLPEIPGLAPLWGDAVFHCPFCHGWEVRDAPVGVLADGARAVHAALLMRGWTDDIVLLTGDPGDGRAVLEAAGVRIDGRPVAEVRAAGDGLEVVFADGAVLNRRALMVAAWTDQRSALAERLGVRFGDPNPLSAEAVWVDEFGRTSVPGVFAAGDVTVQLPQVAAAVAAGSKVAAAVVQSLLGDEFGLPVPAWKEDVSV
ncbi:pyridine nucleotide-disulfide oxidoreductase [Mycobacterium sp. IS-1742]|uniref:NAD(P)/FAD-dependent oxidoreductase n=1 Tax=Mycobacterium sp. IS-1742 TaxID=1772285 RepID=UPI0007401DF4|nr:NAD(P)/FAD-dependent oxidoreductase [Mycobacterium sp. IS-1742]KUI29145.1 pyridine nucleotide-disulfide oxidoreductase [Mycobacterium sp. IS-1742]